jgi:uncharacterized membrane protein YfcA
MWGQIIGLVVVFVVAMTVRPREEVTRQQLKQLPLVALAVGAFAGVVGYLVGRRGVELVVIAVLWALLLPAVALGRSLRARQSSSR